MEDENRDVSLSEQAISVSVGFTGLLTAMAIFFTGMLISKFEVYGAAIKIPVLFLIISTFGFLYSTLIYANASGELVHLKWGKVDRHLFMGNVISEYLGVYFLVLSIPLVINAITADVFLRVSTLIISMAGLIVYHHLGFSIMERHYKKWHYLFVSWIILLEIGLFLTQNQNNLYFTSLATILIVSIFSLSYFAKHED